MADLYNGSTGSDGRKQPEWVEPLRGAHYMCFTVLTEEFTAFRGLPIK